MTNLVNLKGEAIATAPEPNRTLAILKNLVDQIETGQFSPDKLLILYTVPHANDSALVDRHTLDSDMTVSEVLFALEMAKAELIGQVRQ